MSSLTGPGPYHILAYGTLLGTTFFQSFVAGIIQFNVLPRPQFAQLQQATFPPFFALQTLLPAVVALTLPPRAAAASRWNLVGVLEDENRWSAAVPLGVMFVTAAANWVYVGPETTRVMRRRKHQETRDGKKSYEKGPHSPEMERLNRSFGVLHGVSTVVNLVGFGGMIWYGFTLGAKI